MPTKRKPSKVAELQETVKQLVNNEQYLQEQVRELELAMDDVGWRRMSAEGDLEFSRPGLQQIMRVSRIMFLKNPLINRAVTLQAIYVWAQGVTVSSDDETVQEVVDAFMQDERNMVELTGHQARTMKEQDLQVLGNLYFAFFSALDTGATIVRTIPAEEVQEIICSPEDRREVWFYKRQWTVDTFDIGTGVITQQQRTAYYPDVNYDPTDKPEVIGGNPVVWGTPVYHVRVGGLSDMKFGVPETYQAHDWARAYNANLEDWASIIRAHARFAFQLTTQGGAAGVAAAKAKFNTTLGVGGSMERNPPPLVGSTFIAPQGTELAAVKTAGSVTDPNSARRLLLMVCSGFGMPESFFGDVSVGTLATAKSLDRPTELKFKDRQELWKAILVKILTYVVNRSKGAANGRLRLVGTTAPQINVEFPPILEHDIAEQMAAITAGATLNGSPKAGTIDDDTLSRLILQALGVPNINDALELIKKQREEDAAKAEEQTAAQADAQAAAQDGAVAEAVRDLVEVVSKLKAKAA